MESQASQDGIQVGALPYILGMVVAGENYEFRADLDRATLRLSGESVVITP